MTWGSVAVGALAIAALVIFLTRSQGAQSPFVTTLQHGEFRTVPNTCHVYPDITLNGYVGGPPRLGQSYSYPDQSQCTYTVDAKPNFRVLTVTVQAYQPNAGLAPGNGGATANATYMFGRQSHLLAKPPRGTPQAAAAITTLNGLGDQAISAAATIHVTGITDERVTVLVRYRNVLVTTSLQAQVSGGFGPVSTAQLQASAVGAARDMLAAVQGQPTVS